ncbi:thioredoxin domain-containing protein [Alicyclobacillus fastidiosus]|uniref:Thioredoxin domain-containing protein n=1 Tax=Alicyclobacillus fastidiosus TaxID=392011 RepID=A0ABY6ZM32_9BACL|nr:thioredoxin domain-containing protein [Alicyclobacillus fastidiosus]WAH43980.1 thioredoxin domain-containing protein [Alicyclobacillus fastidiosus]
MAHESFEDEQVAQYLNEHYVAIKVDREERPDIDHVYMMYCQALTGEGGWPLTVIMTPEGHPFFAGTYFPKTSRYGRPGLIDILQQLATKWANEADTIQRASADITNRMQPIFAAAPAEFQPGPAIEKAYRQLKSRFDPEYGGFSDAPKFPSFHQLMFLLRYHRFSGEQDALQMAKKTMLSIIRGGIHDHVGGGLARYSTDALWRVPHFEKMLYDNALGVLAATELYQATADETFKSFVTRTMSYLSREMTSEEGAYYAAQDADSEGQEGRFYVWRPDEIWAALGEELGEMYCAFYDVTEEGNFEGDSVPNLIDVEISSFAASRGLSVDELSAKMEAANELLLEWRAHRTPPGTDDKVLTAWNALMIAASAKAGAAFADDEYIGNAVRALSFVEEQLVRHDGRLLARYREGESGILAYADDYAYLVWAYIEVYQATLDTYYLRRAMHWQQQMNDLFWDVEEGGYYLAGKDAERLIATPKSAYDGATPSANSVAAYNLSRLYAITGESHLAEQVDGIFGAFGEFLNEAPAEHLYMLMAGMLVAVGSTEVVFAEAGTDRSLSAFLHNWHQTFQPEAIVLKPDARVQEVDVYPVQDGRTTVYVCRHFACERPVHDWQEASQSVRENPPRLR